MLLQSSLPPIARHMLVGQSGDRMRSAGPTAGLTNVDLRKMDAEHLEFPDQAFDFVTCAFSVFLFPDIAAALREMHRVCKPGGCIGLSAMDRTPAPFGPAQPMLIQQMLECESVVTIPQPFGLSPSEIESHLSQFDFKSIDAHSEANEIVCADL